MVKGHYAIPSLDANHVLGKTNTCTLYVNIVWSSYNNIREHLGTNLAWSSMKFRLVTYTLANVQRGKFSCFSQISTAHETKPANVQCTCVHTQSSLKKIQAIFGQLSIPPPPLPSPSSQRSFPLAICTYGLEFSSLCVDVISDLFFHAGNHSRDQRRASHHRWHRAYRPSPGVFLTHINSEHCNHILY